MFVWDADVTYFADRARFRGRLYSLAIPIAER